MRPLNLGDRRIGLGLAAFAISLAIGRGIVHRVAAHQVRVAEDIGGTLHIEPNDRPVAGEEALIWFALTRRGGISLQLEECDCGVRVLQMPLTDRPEVLASPELRAVEAENYRGIPGADVTFPEAGAYAISISGEPVEANDFEPFELTFDVIVVGQ